MVLSWVQACKNSSTVTSPSSSRSSLCKWNVVFEAILRKSWYSSWCNDEHSNVIKQEGPISWYIHIYVCTQLHQIGNRRSHTFRVNKSLLLNNHDLSPFRNIILTTWNTRSTFLVTMSISFSVSTPINSYTCMLGVISYNFIFSLSFWVKITCYTSCGTSRDIVHFLLNIHHMSAFVYFGPMAMMMRMTMLLMLMTMMLMLTEAVTFSISSLVITPSPFRS